MIKKHLIIIIICFIISFLLSCLYPVRKEFYLCVKNFICSKTIVSSNEIVSVNYKREQNGDNKFVVSKHNPFFALVLNDRYIKNIQINFKEPLQENLKLKLFLENSNEENSNLKNINIRTLVENVSYEADIDENVKNLIFIVGENIEDSFVLDNIIYHENYKYYLDKLVCHNYWEQIKNKSFWKLLFMIFILSILFVEYFIIRKIIYRRIKMKKEGKNG